MKKQTEGGDKAGLVGESKIKHQKWEIKDQFRLQLVLDTHLNEQVKDIQGDIYFHTLADSCATVKY